MKNSPRNTRVILLSFLLLLITWTGYAGNAFSVPKLIPYRQGKLWGYCDRNKKIVIPCIYNETQPFGPDGLARVNMDFMENCGLIDTLGNIVVPTKYTPYQFKYMLIPNDDGRQDKYGAYDAYRWNDHLVVVIDQESMYVLNEQTPFVVNNETTREIHDRSGNRLLNDSLYFVTTFPEMGSPIHIIAKSRRDNKSMILDMKGRPLNARSFDYIDVLDSFHFIGATNKLRELYTLDGEKLTSADHFFPNSYGPWVFTWDNLYDMSKRRYIGEGFSHAYKYYILSEKFIVVPHRIDKGPISYTVLDTGLNELIPGIYDAAEIDFPFEKLFLYNGAGVSCFDLNGMKLFSLEDADTIRNISSTRYVVKTSTGYGIWSSATKSFAVKPIYKALNYTMQGRLILLDQNGSYIVTDSNGIYSPDDVYKKAMVAIHELDYIPSKPPQAGVAINPVSFYKAEMFTGMDEDTYFPALVSEQMPREMKLSSNSVNFIPYKKTKYLGELYKVPGAEQLASDFISKVTCIIALKEDGTKYVIDQRGRKISLGKRVEFMLKLGNIVVYKDSLRPGKWLSCTSMDGVAIKNMQFSETGDFFYYRGVLHQVLKKGIGFNFMNGCVNEYGKIVYLMTFSSIHPFSLNATSFHFSDIDSLDRQRGHITWSKTIGTKVFMDDSLLCKVAPGLLVYEWLGDFGIVRSRDPKFKGDGVINKYGKLIVPPLYEIESIKDGLIGVSRISGVEEPSADPDSIGFGDGDFLGGKKFLGYFDMNGNKYF